MTGIGNVRSDYEKLLTELQQIISKENDPATARKKKAADNGLACGMRVPRAGEMKGVPARKEKVALDDAAGRICAASIIPYPPGSPIVCPGEIITQEMINYLKMLLDEEHKLIGIDRDYRIFVGR
jgi:lysine decarboxylase